MGRKHYGADKIAQTRARLVSNAGYIKPTAFIEGVGKETVVRWAEGKYPEHVTEKEVHAAQAEVSEELAKAWENVASLGTDKVVELIPTIKSAKDAAIVAAIGTDKANLLRGRPTERTEVVDFVSWLRQPPADRAKSGTNVVPEPAPELHHVVKQN